MTKSKTKHVDLFPDRVFRSFSDNIRSLEVFVEEIGSYAEKRDLSQKQSVADVKKQISSLLSNENVKVFKVKKSDRARIEFTNEDAAKKFRELSSLVIRKPKEQTEILRQGVLVLVISYFEVLLSQLIQTYYLQFPMSLSSDKSLSLAEIRNLGGLKEAEQYLIETEADTVIRKKTKEQLDYFRTRLFIDLAPVEPHLEDLVEISQRRNVVVHNNGEANKLYISNISKELVARYQIKEGQKLIPSGDYIDSAVSTIFVVGNYLIQACWRKWFKDMIDMANSTVATVVFDELDKNRYAQVLKHYRTVNSLDGLDDSTSRLMLVNCCIALKNLGEVNEMNSLLDSTDWSSCTPDFLAALHLLKSEYDVFIFYLEKALKSGDFEKDHIDSWPLFRLAKKHRKFQKWLKDQD